ncbi:MAG: Mini-ribonuclease 3 [Candidatus Merdivicinus sp.]|jgi:ribonuclease-3 family protein
MEIADAKQLSPLTLAFLGDAVFELHVREKLAEQGSMPVSVLHYKAVAMVCARSQAKAVSLLDGILTEEELRILKRGRNTHSHVPKNANPSEYRFATGLEALFGFLHITGNYARELELFELIWKNRVE